MIMKTPLSKRHKKEGSSATTLSRKRLAKALLVKFVKVCTSLPRKASQSKYWRKAV